MSRARKSCALGASVLGVGAPSAFGVLVVGVFGAGAFRVVASSVLLASVLGVLGVGALDSVISATQCAQSGFWAGLVCALCVRSIAPCVP